MVISFLLKKRTNPTLYLPISYFGKKNPPTQSCAFIILYSILNLLKTFNNLTTFKYPWYNFKNWDYRTQLCQYDSHIWVSLFLFWFIFYHLCIDHYHTLSMIFFNPLDACFLLLTMCVHSPIAYANHSNSSTSYYTWLRFLIFSTHPIY
jgi:hypothetical protein